MKSLDRYRPFLDILTYAALFFFLWLVSKKVIDRFTDDPETGFTYEVISTFGLLGAIWYIANRITKWKKPKDAV
jgi:hypothetical protein|tara:strand:- start:116 stop:337 length:222 start_codon:yes stop_codon:yes gene_type:complete